MRPNGTVQSASLVRGRRTPRMDTAVTTIAKRYAQALFETYETFDDKNGALSAAETLFAVLSPELEERLAKPTFSAESKKAFLDEVIKAVPLDQHFERTLYLLWENTRLSALRPFLSKLTEFLDESLGIQRVEYLTAKELGLDQQESVRQKLEEALGKKVRLTFTLNASLKAGCIVRVGHRVIDMSLKTRLGNLKEAISQGV